MNVCMCGAEDGYPHEAMCPYPLYRASVALMDKWCQAERKRGQFYRAWVTLQASGACDGWGGMESRRVWAEYLAAGLPDDVADFIYRRANILSDGTEPRTA